MSAPPSCPTIVARAFDVSRRAGFVSFCRNETGRLLATLAATRGRHHGRVRHRLRGRHRVAALRRPRRRRTILTAELDAELAGAAPEIFADDPQVEVLAADWSTLRDTGPLLAAVPRLRGAADGPASTPSPTWSRPAASSCSTTSRRARSGRRCTGGRVDTLREQWLTDDRFTTVEVMVAPDAAVLIATKR